MRNVEIYRKPNHFAGWPANYGIWSWGDEIVVGFTVGRINAQGGFHARDKTQPFVAKQARSLDGGETWRVEGTPWPTPGGRGVLSADEHVDDGLSAAQAIELGQENRPGPCPGDVDFTHPDFALMCARTGLGKGTAGWFYTSTNRCRTWQGPYGLPLFGQAGIEARTDYLVSGPRELTIFLTASKEDGGEGKGVFAARTEDGGRSFRFLSWVAQSENGHVIMPSSVQVSTTRIVTAVRCREHTLRLDPDPCWIDLYLSEDGGRSFEFLATPVADTGIGGNPPSMIQLADGRLCLTYGYRAEPYGMRAVLSDDGGATWSEPVNLREGAGNQDIGYPRSVQRPDGAVVTVYYYNDDPAGERYLGVTIWQP